MRRMRYGKGSYTCRKSLCFLCPNPYPFPTGFSENPRLCVPGFETVAAKMLRINPDPKKTARDIFCGRSGYRLGFFRWPLGKSLGNFPVGAQDITWDLSVGRSGSSSGIFANVPYPIGRRFQKSRVRPNPLNNPPDAFPNVPNPPSFLCLTNFCYKPPPLKSLLPPHALPNVHCASPLLFFIDIFLTGEPLKCRPRPMKVPTCTALEGWGTMDVRGHVDQHWV